MEDFSAFIKKISESWGTLPGLFIAFLVPLIPLSLIPDYAIDNNAYWAILFVCELLIFVYWWLSKKGGISKDKLRIVLALHYDTDAEKPELDEDFGKELRKILKEGDLGKSIVLITAYPAECNALESDSDIESLLVKKNAAFMIFARIRTREDQKSKMHTVELKAVVRHAKMQAQAQAAFAKEISSVFSVEKIKIPKSEQLPHLALTAEWLGFSSRYIISLAAFTVGNLEYADKLLCEAARYLSRLPANIRHSKALEDRLRSRHYETVTMQAQRAHVEWRKLRNKEMPAVVVERLKFASQLSNLREEHSHLLAQALFVTQYDAKECERLVRGAMFNHPIVHLNLGFLLAWQGKYLEARKSYKAAVKKSPDEEILEQVFTFLEWLRRENPDKAHVSWWCEVILKEDLKIDAPSVRKIFENLARRTGEFPSEEIERIKKVLTR